MTINEVLKTPTLKDLEHRFPKVDFKRVLEFENPRRKKDPDNPGRMLEPIYRAQPMVTINVDDRAAEIRYYRQMVKGTKDRASRYTPSSIAIGKVFSVDLRNPETADYALAYLLLSHPQLGRSFRMKDRKLEAKHNIEKDVDVLRAEGMLRDLEHSAYITDEQLENIMVAVGMEPASGLSDDEYREQLLGYARVFPKDFLSKIGGERLRVQTLITDAVGQLMLDYDGNKGEYRHVRIVDDGERVERQQDINPFLSVHRTRRHEHEAVLVEYLSHATNRGDLDILRENLRELKTRQRANVATTPALTLAGAKKVTPAATKKVSAEKTGGDVPFGKQEEDFEEE